MALVFRLLNYFLLILTAVAADTSSPVYHMADTSGQAEHVVEDTSGLVSHVAAAASGSSRHVAPGLSITTYTSETISHLPHGETSGARRGRRGAEGPGTDAFLSHGLSTPRSDHLHPWRVTIQVRQTSEEKQRFMSTCQDNATRSAVKSPWRHVCGGSLVAEGRVLTAASCVFAYVHSINDLRVGVGWHDIPYGLEGRDDAVQILDVAEIGIHPYFNSTAIVGKDRSINLAVLCLTTNVTIESGRVEVARLAGPGDFHDNDCQLSGWGAAHCGPLDKLHYLNMRVIRNWRCQTVWRTLDKGYTVHDAEICALDVRGMGSPCVGDAGGGLVCDVGAGPHVVAVTSWHLAGCRGCFPAVFQRAHPHKDFIFGRL